jgi:hypothetical protein
VLTPNKILKKKEENVLACSAWCCLFHFVDNSLNFRGNIFSIWRKYESGCFTACTGTQVCGKFHRVVGSAVKFKKCFAPYDELWKLDYILSCVVDDFFTNQWGGEFLYSCYVDPAELDPFSIFCSIGYFQRRIKFYKIWYIRLVYIASLIIVVIMKVEAPTYQLSPVNNLISVVPSISSAQHFSIRIQNPSHVPLKYNVSASGAGVSGMVRYTLKDDFGGKVEGNTLMGTVLGGEARNLTGRLYVSADSTIASLNATFDLLFYFPDAVTPATSYLLRVTTVSPSNLIAPIVATVLLLLLLI